jgi:WD40 repeat protein
MKTLAITLTLLCCLALAPAAEASWPGADGAIAFSRTAGGNSDLWIASPSGKQRRLTATPRFDETSPTFSPDGRTIAYVRRGNGDADIWLMRSDGRGERPLVTGELDEFQPSFFPSGRSLAFTVFDGERDWTVYSVRRDGEGRQRLVNDATFPVVSPNGRLLAYSADGDGGGIRLLNLRSRRVRELTTGSAQELDFSPNGQRILFIGQRQCRARGTLRFLPLVIGLGGRHSRFLRRGCDAEVAGAAWSPSGTRIVYALKTQRGRQLAFRLRMMTAGGAPAFGAPRHVAGTQELFPAWQPLR